MTKNIIKYILNFSLIFAFLPVFVFYYAANRTIPFFMIIVAIIFFSFLFIFPKFLFKTLTELYYQTPFKCLLYFFIYIIISSTICYFCGYYNTLTQLLMAITGGFLLRCIFVYIYPSLVIKFIPLRKIIKFFMVVYFCIFIWGLLEFIGAKYNISIINKLVYFFSNYKAEDLSIVIESHSGIPRIRSVFQEAGFLSKFIAINLPIIYDVSLSRYKILNNNILNFILKKSLISLTWICIILTQSPIFLIINIIITILIFRKKILIILKKHYISATIVFLSILIVGIFIGVSDQNITNENFLIRITNVIKAIPEMTFEKLIEVEPSLATRIVCYTILFLVFLKHPIFGIGFLNRGTLLHSYMTSSSIPLTPELITRFSRFNTATVVNLTTLTELLSTTGIFGFIFYCIFMINTIKQLNKVKHKFYGLEYVFVNALKNSILTLFILALSYEQCFIENHTFFYPGLAAAIILVANNSSLIKRKDVYEH